MGTGQKWPQSRVYATDSWGWAERRWCPAPSGKTALSLGAGGKGTSIPDCTELLDGLEWNYHLVELEVGEVLVPIP